MSILQTFLNKQKTSVISIVKIVRKQSNTSFVVQDIQQRQFVVESDGLYKIGQTVTVSDGIIIGRTKSMGTFKSFVV